MRTQRPSLAEPAWPMKLLLKGDVPSVIINDLDRAVYCMWDAIVNRSEDLCTFVSDVEVTVDEWKRHRETYRNQKDVDDFSSAAQLSS